MAEELGADVLHELLNEAPFAVILMDTSGEIRWANRSVAEHLGFQPGDLVGENGFAMLHPDDLERAAASASVMHTSPVRARGGVYRMQQADGSYVECMLSANPHEIGGERLMQVAFIASPARVAAFGALEITMRGGTLIEAFQRLTHTLRVSMPQSFGIVFDDLESDRTRLAGDLEPVLAGVTPDGTRDQRPTTPWHEAARTREMVIVDDLASLPDDIASVATARGWSAISVVPVPSPVEGSPTLLVNWAPEPAMAPVIARNVDVAMAPVVKLLTEREHHLRTLEAAATHDWLTGIGNRARFFPFLQKAISEDGAGVLYLDLDGFKPVNDRLGHDAGDALLVEVAQRLQKFVPDDALVARLGGDEFAVALPGRTLEDSVDIANRLVDEVRRPIRLTDGDEVVIGVSIGVAIAHPKLDVDEAVAAADQALLAAKEAGKGCVRTA